MDVDRFGRFFSKVDLGPAHKCWPWRGKITTNGYGVSADKVVHRIAYEFLVGPIPEGLTLDHLCRNRACVNPAHLEPCTLKTNVLRGEGLTAIHSRKTHCVNGHEFTLENTYLRPTGGRRCRTCARESAAERRAA